MAQGFDTDTDLMRNLADTLHRASATLDSIGASVPGAPDAGEMTPSRWPGCSASIHRPIVCDRFPGLMISGLFRA